MKNLSLRLGCSVFLCAASFLQAGPLEDGLRRRPPGSASPMTHAQVVEAISKHGADLDIARVKPNPVLVTASYQIYEADLNSGQKVWLRIRLPEAEKQKVAERHAAIADGSALGTAFAAAIFPNEKIESARQMYAAQLEAVANELRRELETPAVQMIDPTTGQSTDCQTAVSELGTEKLDREAPGV